MHLFPDMARTVLSEVVRRRRGEDVGDRQRREEGRKTLGMERRKQKFGTMLVETERTRKEMVMVMVELVWEGEGGRGKQQNISSLEMDTNYFHKLKENPNRSMFLLRNTVKVWGDTMARNS